MVVPRSRMEASSAYSSNQARAGKRREKAHEHVALLHQQPQHPLPFSLGHLVPVVDPRERAIGVDDHGSERVELD
jgi:hypothetical protein